MSEDKNAAFNQAMIAGGMYGPNPYSQFPQGIQGTSYRGAVTDAMGKPIAQPPGMTLNQTPAQPQQQAAPQSSGYVNPAMRAGANADMLQAMSSLMPTGGGSYMAGPGTPKGFWDAGGPGGQGAGIPGQGQPQAAPQPAAQPDNSYRNALDLLANPGAPDPVGATVPQNPSINNQPSVLSQFLAGNNKGGTGAGGYSNTAFFDTLNKLKGAPA